MSTHKHFDKICCVVLAVVLLLTVLFMNAECLGIQKMTSVMGYENKLRRHLHRPHHRYYHGRLGRIYSQLQK